jgi:LysM repeat protein
MHKIDLGIIVVGSLLTVATIAGVLGISSSKINSMNDVYVSEVAKNMSAYTTNYNRHLSARYLSANTSSSSSETQSIQTDGTTINVNVGSDDSTNVTITHNGETVDSQDLYTDDSVNVNISVNENDDVTVDVTNPEEEVPVMVDGQEIYLSDVLTKQEDGTMAYLIQPGDTLCYISRLFGFSVDEIAEFNHVDNVNMIYSNSTMRVPNWDHIESDTVETTETTESEE